MAFDGFKKFFRPTDRTIALPDDPFVVIDREKTADRLRLDERARRNGERNFPPADAAARDDVEEEIIAEIQEHANRTRINGHNNYRLYSERLSELGLLRELVTITGASAQAQGDFKAIVIKRVGRLDVAKDAIRDSYKELAEFKEANGLSRPAYLGLNSAYAYSLIGVAWVIESAINTAFLRVNDDYGLVGGFVAAAVVAFINILLSAVIGRLCLPYLFHKSAVRKGLAAFGATVWLAFLVTWNLLAGHFRDAKGLGIDHPETEALRLLAERTWHFESIYSYGLLVLGMTFSVLAALAAYKMKDPYPGYGETYKRHLDRCDDYSNEIEYAFDELKATRDDAIAEATELQDELRRQFSERGQIIAAREGLRSRFRQTQEDLEGLCNFLLSRYRAENIRSRPDGQVPTHFKERWTLQRAELPDAHDINIDEDVIRAQQVLVTSIATVAADYQAAIERFEHLEAIKRSLANG